MKDVVFHSEATLELDDAGERYDGERPGLGREFLDEVAEAVARIREHPQRFPRYKRTSARFCLVHRFPYVIYFRELEESIWIAAVAHGRRRPGYWTRRKPE